MNIMLTDLRAPTPDAQEIPALDTPPAGGFAGLLRQQLPVVLDGRQQVVELNRYFSENSYFGTNLGMAPQAMPEAGWREYLAQQQVGVDVDADMLAPAPAQLQEAPQHASEQTDPEALLASTMVATTGEFLPVGGNSLPDTATLQPTTDASAAGIAGFDSPPPMPPSTEITASPVLARQAIDPEVAPDANLIDVNPMPAGQPVEPAEQIPQSFPVAPETGRVAAEPEVEGESVLTREPPARPLPVTPDSAPAAPVQASMRMPPLAAAEAISVANPETPRPPERMIHGGIAPAESGPAQQTATLRDVDSAAENLRIADPRDAFRQPQKTPKPAADIPMADAAGGRASDLPVQLTASNAQQAVTAAQPLLHAQAAPGASTPSAQQAVLPGPLDAMNISRNADSSDWGNGLGDRVSWMINQKQNSATIRLDPPSLGKLDVHVRVADDATTITIQTQHAQTRDLIETAALRLRDYLQDSGYQNVNVDVSQRQDQQHTQSQGQDAYADADDEFGMDPVPDSGQSLQSGFVNGEGLVDTFA